jgi:hypothetical protein
MGADRRVLDHGDIVGPGHVGHAAAGMALGQIAFQQVELLGRGLGLDQGARQVGVAVQGLALRAGEVELGHRQPHRDTGVAALAGRAIGDVLAAAEARVGQFVVDVGAVREGQVGEHLPLGHARQIGAGRDRGHEEAKLTGRDMLGHGIRSAPHLASNVTPDRS